MFIEQAVATQLVEKCGCKIMIAGNSVIVNDAIATIIVVVKVIPQVCLKDIKSYHF